MSGEEWVNYVSIAGRLVILPMTSVVLLLEFKRTSTAVFRTWPVANINCLSLAQGLVEMPT